MRSIFSQPAAWIALVAIPLAVAAASPIQGRCCPTCGHAVCCPQPELVKEQRYCWRVECKTICVPAIRWPWQHCCEPPACGRIKTVKVLKKVEYECQRCGYKWAAGSVVCDAEK